MKVEANGLIFIRMNISLTNVPTMSLDQLEQEINFHQRSLRIYGKQVLQPRLVAWYGPCAYSYSGSALQAANMPKCLSELSEVVSAIAGESFNSVMCNLYRDGSDSVAWHSDDEVIFGGDPIIASVSFGAVRRFAVRENTTGNRQVWDLEDGSLLVMGKDIQPNYQHTITKTKRQVGKRINLTFRKAI